MYCVFRLCQINYYHTIPYLDPDTGSSEVDMFSTTHSNIQGGVVAPPPLYLHPHAHKPMQ